MAMITGFNHVTLSVSDVEASFAFYTKVLELRPVARWHKGAHLCAGNNWLCLSLDAAVRHRSVSDYSHLAFTVSEGGFSVMEQRLRETGVAFWQNNHSEGDSLYFLGPDGHKLEIHVSDLKARIRSLRSVPPAGLVVFE